MPATKCFGTQSTELGARKCALRFEALRGITAFVRREAGPWGRTPWNPAGEEES